MRGVTLLKFERELKGLFFVIRLILDLGHEHLRVNAACVPATLSWTKGVGGSSKGGAKRADSIFSDAGS